MDARSDRASLRRRRDRPVADGARVGTRPGRRPCTTRASKFAIVDDRHFLVSGLWRERLHAPLRTEHDGKQVALFAIDERLRYLIPFQPPRDTLQYLRRFATRDELAVLADDGEKFGGWPGTKEWVYEKGWLDDFTRTILGAVERGEVLLSRSTTRWRTCRAAVWRTSRRPATAKWKHGRSRPTRQIAGRARRGARDQSPNA